MLTSITLEESYLRATMAGEFLLNAAREGFYQILDAVAKYEVQCVLVDGSFLTGSPTPVEQFWYGTFVFEEVEWRVKLGRLNTFPRLAYILLPPFRDLGTFGENIASNRGLDMRTFERSDEALRWLLLEGDR